MTNRLLLLVVLIGGSLQAQWKWPEKSANLKVLPADTEPATLRNTMIGFTRMLGVRCWYCHEGEEGKPLDTFNFTSDDKQTKTTARLMMKMTKLINSDFIATIDRAEHVEVTCQTCHRGNSMPELLENVLAATYFQLGLQATVKQYRDYREKFYGGFTFDFREPTLTRLAAKLDENKKTSDAVEILKLNAEFYPDSPDIAFLTATYLERIGDKAGAVAGYEKTLRLAPKHEQAKKRLDALQKK